MHMSDAPAVTNNEAASRFEVQEEGRLAELTYRRNGKRLVLIHTEVPVELERRGIGGRLVSAAVDHVAREGMTVVPLCPFARSWLERNADVAARASVDWATAARAASAAATSAARKTRGGPPNTSQGPH
jgi:predicted GNAT family acetyltransferase